MPDASVQNSIKDTIKNVFVQLVEVSYQTHETTCKTIKNVHVFIEYQGVSRH